jgi:hypothetical protein
MPIGNRSIFYQLLACLLLAVSLLVQVRDSASTKTAVDVESQPVASEKIRQTVAAFVAPSIKSFAEILERPLFIPGREPPPQPVAETAPATPPTPLRLQLEGVAITDDARIAVVRDLSTREILRLMEGNMHQGWVLETVDTKGARFKHGEKTRELFLDTR